MTTTLNIPEDLARLISARARQEGRDFQAEANELIRIGLASLVPEQVPIAAQKSVIETDPETGFLVVRCGKDAPVRQMSIEEIIAMENETLEQEDLDRLGIPH